jgi:hypothetical protein
MTAAPDYVEPVVGWRLWLVVPDQGQVWLESVTYPQRWPTRCPLPAQCLRGRRSHLIPLPPEHVSHAAPVESCHCGIYATTDIAMLAPYFDGHYPGKAVIGRVVGLVSLWGPVVECERGWRGALAYPRTIYVPQGRNGRSDGERSFSIARSLGRYGVPVDLINCRAATELLSELGASGPITDDLATDAPAVGSAAGRASSLKGPRAPSSPPRTRTLRPLRRMPR